MVQSVSHEFEFFWVCCFNPVLDLDALQTPIANLQLSVPAAMEAIEGGGERVGVVSGMEELCNGSGACNDYGGRGGGIGEEGGGNGVGDDCESEAVNAVEVGVAAGEVPVVALDGAFNCATW